MFISEGEKQAVYCSRIYCCLQASLFLGFGKLSRLDCFSPGDTN